VNLLQRSASLPLLLLLPHLASATGIESPIRWITQGEEKPPLLQPPEFYFEVEVRRIAAELHPEVKPAPSVDTAKADLADFRDAIEKKRLAPADPAPAEAAHAAARAALEATKSSEEEDQANKPPPPPAPAEFPSEFADYHRGALAYRDEKREDAQAEWKALLERPAAERHYRTTWATYMLGKLAIEDEDWDAAREWFAKTRAAAKEGFADSLGLAATSVGWDAYIALHHERFAEAAKLYLEQLATGDISAVNSLRVVMSEVFKEDVGETALAELARDPVLQRVGIAGAVAGMSPFPGFWGEPAEDDIAARWLKALESIDAKDVRDADRVAWFAYMRGQYDIAKRWLARAGADAPYALWLKAKFAMRDGKLDAATKLLASAVAKLPQDRRVEAYSLGDEAIPPYDVAHGELALLRLNRSEFTAALRMFLQAGLYSDAFYVADGVLTIDELKTFVARETANLPKVAGFWDMVNGEEIEERRDDPEVPWHFYYYGDPARELRSILARRLIRSARYREARPYLDEKIQPRLDEYVALLDRAKAKGTSKADQAEALWKAAGLMLEHGSHLADYFDPVTMAERTTGRDVNTDDSSVIAIKYGEREKIVPPVASTEQQRLKKNAVPALRRYYSTYLAADLAWRSAALLPDQQEKTADRLNRAGSWLKDGDSAAADRFLQAIERRCWKTELGKEAMKKHWFVPVPDSAEEPAKEQEN